ncbi:MAG: VCBS repeat-containing protein [Bacteroidota bacterium]
MQKRLPFLIITLLCIACNNDALLFENRSASKTGIDFKNVLSESDELNILDYLYFYNGGGVAVGDINNDGLQDIYFSGNQVSNKLYLNKGDLKFEDITHLAGVAGNSSWNTGTVMADVNGDGYLDIYVCAVVGIHNFEGHNELFINNGDNTFTEKASEYGLNTQSYSTSATFFDYDLDGDLDLYLLNHAVHTQESFGRVSLRYKRNDKTGDKLFRNDGNGFTDVSEEAGIYGGINGYGLGVSVSDFNQDGYPDLYIGNDFHEDDYFYVNNGDGSFTESLRSFFGHTSRFSMGNDAADINNDGWPDLISLDMTPEDETVLKSSEGDDTYQIMQLRTGPYGYHYQYTRNMLYTNNGERPFTETALLHGVSATDWSWSALFNDYNQDGHQDLYISNGIPRRPNDLDFIRFVSNREIQKQMNDSKLMDQKALELMPSGAVPNYLFFGNGTGRFQDVSAAQMKPEETISGATATGDLDNDGDLDIITNNINAPAGIYINTTNEKGNYLKVQLKYEDKNPFGIGAKLYAYHDGKLQFRELFPNRGWQASSAPIVHFGLGKFTQLDSVKVVWPDRSFQTIYKVTPNQLLTVSPENPQPYTFRKKTNTPLFRKVIDNLGIDYIHKEDDQTDFNYQKLIPYEVSKRGPAFAIGDLNGDGKDDLFFGGAKYQKASVYLQQEDGFELGQFPGLSQDSIYEDISATISRPGFGNKNVLTVLSGGNFVSPSKKYLANRFYSYTNGALEGRTEPESYYNSSVAIDADSLSHEYLEFIGNHTDPLNFGKLPPAYWRKKGGNEEFDSEFGMVTNAIWDDFNKDGQTDLIVIGEWMAPRFFKNESGVLSEVEILDQNYTGLWQTIIPFDIDHDGDQDYLLGNWGLNSKFKASQKSPLRMYYSDFDENGTTETVLAIEKNGQYYPLLGLNELAEQMVFLRKKFPNYKDFAGKTVEEVMGTDLLEKATLFEVTTLTSGFLRNNGNTFIFESFPDELQTAPIKAFTSYDFDGSGKESVLAAGNYFGVIPFHGRFDSFSGALIHSETEIELGNTLGLMLEHKSVRHLKTIQLNNKPYLLIVYNNDAAEIYDFSK